MGDFKIIEWLGDRIRLLDQTQLPQAEVFIELDDYRQMAAAITEMKIRGAPAIGVAAAYGMAMASLGRVKKDTSLTEKALELFKQIIHYYTTPGMMPAKTDPVPVR